MDARPSQAFATLPGLRVSLVVVTESGRNGAWREEYRAEMGSTGRNPPTFLALPGMRQRVVAVTEVERDGTWEVVSETTQGIFTPLEGEIMHRLVDRARIRRREQRVTARMSTTPRGRPPPPPPSSPPQQPEREYSPAPLPEDDDFRRFQERQRPDHVVPETPPASPVPTVRVFARAANESGFVRVAPPRPVEGPRAQQPPAPHVEVPLPSWGRRVPHIWIRCLICLNERVHSSVECTTCGNRPACCSCIEFLENTRLNRGRCPVCRSHGDQ